MARSGRPRGTRSDGRAAREELLAATVATLADHGFSAASARAIGKRAGATPGTVFYHFGSMDELLAETFDRLNDAQIERLRRALGPPLIADWPLALADAYREEMGRSDTRALLELAVGASTSELLGERVRVGTEKSVAFTRELIEQVLGDSPLASLFPVALVAELAAACFFGLKVSSLVGRDIDQDAIARMLGQLVRLMVPSAGRTSH